MTKAVTFLDQNRLYVSWGILCVVVVATAMITKIMITQDQMLLNQDRWGNRIEKLEDTVSQIKSDLYFNNPSKQ